MGRDWQRVGELVEKIGTLGLTLKEGAQRFGVKPRVLYEYNRRRKRQAGQAESTSSEAQSMLNSEEGKSGEGKSAVPTEVQELILSYRRAHPTQGFKRIQDELRVKHLVVMSRKHIRQVVKEAGLLESCDSSFDKKPQKGMRRFEAPRPGVIWQMDVAYVYLRNLPVFNLVVVLDDHSRFCVKAELCRNQWAETLIAVLEGAMEEHACPAKLMTDQGSGFYCWSGEQTRFQEYLDDRGIEHLVAEPHSPQTQGKVERFIQTIRRELLSKVKFESLAEAREAIARYVHRYNYERPHQGIGGKRPADRFHGVVGDVEQAELELSGPQLCAERAYVVYKTGAHRVCVLDQPEGPKVYLDGKELREAR